MSVVFSGRSEQPQILKAVILFILRATEWKSCSLMMNNFLLGQMPSEMLLHYVAVFIDMTPSRDGEHHIARVDDALLGDFPSIESVFFCLPSLIGRISNTPTIGFTESRTMDGTKRGTSSTLQRSADFSTSFRGLNPSHVFTVPKGDTN